MTIADNYRSIRNELDQVCIDNGRTPEDVMLLAVSKTTDADGVAQAIDGGAHDFGENRPDQLLEKSNEFPGENWHFIGNIQSRRIGDIVSRAHLIHSLYSEKHARLINDHAEKFDKIQDCLIEVNVSGEVSKSGIAPEELPGFLELCEGLDNISIRGLMTMAPQGDLEIAQKTFHDLRVLKDDVAAKMNPQMRNSFTELSMGMSEDWVPAVIEGSTIIRVGRAIFSEKFII